MTKFSRQLQNKKNEIKLIYDEYLPVNEISWISTQAQWWTKYAKEYNKT